MPANALHDRAARAALSAHFTPEQVAADLRALPRRTLAAACASRPQRTPGPLPAAPGWTRRGQRPWPTSCPLGLWARGQDRLLALTASAVAGNRNATGQAVARFHRTNTTVHADREWLLAALLEEQ